ncbi:MAG: secretin N-terminal domain-containing protein, partial [Rhodospirillaceae bacterium]
AVTFQFTDMPLQGAFNKLMSDFGLDFEYSSDIRTVTISPKGQVRTEFIAMKYIDKNRIDAAKSKFVLGGEVVYHEGAVQLRGDPDQVSKLKEVIALLESSEGDRRKAEEEHQKNEANTTNTMADAQRKAAEAERISAEARQRDEQLQLMRQQRLEIEQITVKVIPVRYASVGPMRIKFQGEDVTIPGLIDSLNVLLGVASAGAGAGQSAGGGSSNNSYNLSALNSDGTPTVQPGALNPVMMGGGASNQQDRSNTVLVRREANAFHGSISADSRTNSVIVRGSPHEIQQVIDLVAKLDRETAQIEIEVMIVFASKEASEQLGVNILSEVVDASSSGGQVGGALGGPGGVGVGSATGGASTPNQFVGALTGGSDAFVKPVGLVSPISLMNAASSGTMASFLYRGGRTALAAKINALSQDNLAETLSAPRVVTLDNLAAKITNDRTVFVRSQGLAAGAVSTLSQIPAGLTLKITPSVLRRDDLGDDNLIRLLLEAENTSVDLGELGAAKSGNVVQTQVVIPEGSTFVLGSMLSDDRSEKQEGIPFLQAIPLLGELFKNRDSRHKLTQALFFITPRIVPRADLYVKDVAHKRYLQTLRADLEQTSDELHEHSKLLNLDMKSLEEDE